MFDNLRDSAESSFYEEDQNSAPREPAARAVVRRRTNTRFLGMTSQQRFLISVMLLFTVCILGTLALFVMGKMSFF
jgi:hypothetical protein